MAMARLENEVEDWIRDRAIAVKPSESNKSRYVNFPGYSKAIREGFLSRMEQRNPEFFRPLKCYRCLRNGPKKLWRRGRDSIFAKNGNPLIFSHIAPITCKCNYLPLFSATIPCFYIFCYCLSFSIN